MTDTSSLRTNAQWADYYGQWGWQIFPVYNIGPDGKCTCPQKKKDEGKCRPGKHPIPFNGFKSATSDPDKIKKWWEDTPDANIGIATGLESGLVVIDADGDTGVESVGKLGYPDTVTAISGSRTGRHYFF